MVTATIIILVALLLCSIGVNIAMGILVKRQLVRIQIYEQYILDCRTHVSTALQKMKHLDQQNTFATRLNDKGTFESDDEVGGIFKDLMETVENLNNIIEK